MRNLRPVSRAEQEKMGLRRIQRPANYVPASSAPAGPQLPAQSSTSYTIEAAPSAQLGSITHTNAVDRAKGYLWVQTPLAVVVSILVLAVGKALADFPLLSFAAFLVFWVSFAACWLVGWFITLLLSAEGVAFYEARRKWNVVESEHAERWAHYNRQLEAPDALLDERPQGAPDPRRGDDIDWTTIYTVTAILWGMIILTWLIIGG